MKIVERAWFLHPRFQAINLFGVLYVKKNARINDVLINHESIHTAQMKEMLYIFFYLWYVVECLIRLCMKGNAYRNISFEREAYKHQNELDYANLRNRFEWLKHI